MKKQEKLRRLTLSRETLRCLDDSTLRELHGGQYVAIGTSQTNDGCAVWNGRRKPTFTDEAGWTGRA